MMAVACCYYLPPLQGDTTAQIHETFVLRPQLLNMLMPVAVPLPPPPLAIPGPTSLGPCVVVLFSLYQTLLPVLHMYALFLFRSPA